MGKHTNDEEIEIRLSNYVGRYYHFQYRFKKRKTIWEKIFGCSWNEPSLFKYYLDREDNPYEYLYAISYDAGKTDLDETIKELKENIKTYQDFLNYFDVSINMEHYKKCVMEHEEWVNKTYKYGRFVK